MTLLPRIIRKAKRVAGQLRERIAPRERYVLLTFESVQLDDVDRLRDAGMIPNAVAGSGLGEITAAYAAGMLSRDEAIAIGSSSAPRIAARKPSCPIYSATFGGPLPDDAPLDATYWNRITAASAGLTDALDAAREDGYEVISNVEQIRSLRVANGWPPPKSIAITAETLDLNAPSVARDPFPYYEALRANGSVHYLPRHDFHLVLGFDDVQSAFARPQLFSSSPWEPIDAVLAAADPPQHTAIRRLISRHFSPAAIDALLASAERHAAQLVKRELDVVAEFAAPISFGIAAQLIGADDVLTESIREASIAAYKTDSPFPALLSSLDTLVARASLYQTLLRHGDGLLGEAEARSLVRLFWIASTSTTERAIAHSVLRLLRHDIDRDPARLQPFIDEVLRLHPAEHLVARRTTADVELGGVTIPCGALVQLCVSAANRDPAHFDDAATLRLDRTQRGLTFGHGIHYCVGAPLARRVVHAALTTLIRELPGFRPLQPLASVRHFRSMMTLAPVELWIGA
ncbi:MAG: cytochrome [Acidobacteria bacterium]|nr:cytochrome [Acidobacteriota bacterium]